MHGVQALLGSGTRGRKVNRQWIVITAKCCHRCGMDRRAQRRLKREALLADPSVQACVKCGVQAHDVCGLLVVMWKGGGGTVHANQDTLTLNALRSIPICLQSFSMGLENTLTTATRTSHALHEVLTC